MTSGLNLSTSAVAREAGERPLTGPSWRGRPFGGAGGHKARGVVGSARVIAFGASNVAPAGAVLGGWSAEDESGVTTTRLLMIV